MKRLISFSKIATVFCVVYLVLEIVRDSAAVPTLLEALFNVLFEVCFMVCLLFMATESKNFRSPAVLVVIAALLKITNTFIGMYVPRTAELLQWSGLVVGSVYLAYLIFLCWGFFKFAKRLPKSSLSRSMAMIYPCTYIFQLIATLIVGIGSTVAVWLFEAIGFIQLICIALFYFSLPKELQKDS